MISLSARQFSMLEFLLHRKEILIHEARKLNQTTFGSLIHRDYIKYKSKPIGIFFVSAEGRAAMQSFHETEIRRKIAKDTLSHYFKEDYAKIRTKIIQMKSSKAA